MTRWMVLLACAAAALAGCQSLKRYGPGTHVILENGNEGAWPIAGGPAVGLDGPIMRFGCGLKDANGMSARHVVIDNNPVPPTIEVADASGKIVHTAAMEFG